MTGAETQKPPVMGPGALPFRQRPRYVLAVFSVCGR